MQNGLHFVGIPGTFANLLNKKNSIVKISIDYFDSFVFDLYAD